MPPSKKQKVTLDDGYVLGFPRNSFDPASFKEDESITNDIAEVLGCNLEPVTISHRSVLTIGGVTRRIDNSKRELIDWSSKMIVSPSFLTFDNEGQSFGRIFFNRKISPWIREPLRINILDVSMRADSLLRKETDKFSRQKINFPIDIGREGEAHRQLHALEYYIEESCKSLWGKDIKLEVRPLTKRDNDSDNYKDAICTRIWALWPIKNETMAVNLDGEEHELCLDQFNELCLGHFYDFVLEIRPWIQRKENELIVVGMTVHVSHVTVRSKLVSK